MLKLHLKLEREVFIKRIAKDSALDNDKSIKEQFNL